MTTGAKHLAGAGDASSTKVDLIQAGSFSQTAAIDLLSKSADNPWSVNTYHSKRAAHRVNELGDIIGEDDAPENILNQPGWDDAGKLRFCVATVADELGVSREDVEGKMRQLFKLVPGIERRVGEVKTADIVRMVASLNDVVKAHEASARCCRRRTWGRSWKGDRGSYSRISTPLKPASETSGRRRPSSTGTPY